MAEANLRELNASNIFNLKGVVAVVTGGGTGIGLYISTTLQANGATVYIIGPGQADLDAVSKKYNDAAAKLGTSGRIYGLEGDIRHKSEATRLAGEIAKREKHVTVLFNNAGIMDGVFTRPTAPTAAAYLESHFNHLTQDTFDNVYRTNSTGHYWMSFAFLPLLEKWKSPENPLAKTFPAQIVITSSMNGWTKDLKTSGESFPYQFSKAAIGQATAVLAHELLPLDIRVNGIAPGLYPTQMTAPGNHNEAGTVKFFANALQQFPMAIPNGPDSATNKAMGSLALMLTVNTYMNGETVLIDGGTLLVHPSSW